MRSTSMWTHYHHERNHQGKGNVLLFPTLSQDAERAGPIQCRERLGGLLKYYERRPHEFFDHTGLGLTGARDKADTPTSVHDWPGCSHSNTDAVAVVDCSSNMTTGLRWTISMVTTVMRALRTCKRYMDIATMRKRGSKKTISRQVCVTSIRILRSGVRRKSHAPF